MKKLIPGIIACCLYFVTSAQQYVLKGKISGFKDGTKFWLKDLNEGREVDSAIMYRQSFTMKGSLTDGPRSFWLYTHTKDSFYYCNLYFDNETVTIKGDSKDMPFYMKITGSKTRHEENILGRQTAAYYRCRDSLTDIVMPLMRKNENQELQKKIWEQVRKIDDTVEVIRVNFIKKYVNSYAGIRELFFLKSKFDSVSLINLYNQIQESYKQHLYARTVFAYIKVGSPLKAGQQYKDFEASDSSGNSHRLSQFLGKYVLLDFTATYCGPCVQAMDELKILNAKFPDKLSIVSFNTDGNRNTWLKGMVRDKPEWLYLWDGKAGHSETVMKYGVTAYPTFFLLNPKGKIIQQWVGYGKNELTQVIEKKLAGGE